MKRSGLFLNCKISSLKVNELKVFISKPNTANSKLFSKKF